MALHCYYRLEVKYSLVKFGPSLQVHVMATTAFLYGFLAFLYVSLFIVLGCYMFAKQRKKRRHEEKMKEWAESQRKDGPEEVEIEEEIPAKPKDAEAKKVD